MRKKRADLIGRVSPGALALAGLLAAFLLAWPALLLGRGQALLYRDLSALYYPAKKAWLDGMRAQGFPPLWDSSVLGGTPYFAELNWGSLNPLNLVFLLEGLISFPVAFNWFLFLHQAFCVAGAWVLGRELTGRRDGAALCAFFFATTGVAWSSLYMVHTLAVVAILPWSFAALARFLRTRSPAAFTGIAACLAVPVLLGDPQLTVLLGALSAAAFVVVLGAKRGLGAGALLASLSGLLSAPQLLPAMDLARLSIRVIPGYQPAEVLAWSFHPGRLLEWLWPMPASWQLPLTNGPYVPEPYIAHTFLGLAPAALVVAALLRRENRRWPAAGLWAACLALLLASFGSYWPAGLAERVVSLSSVFALFRYPERLHVLLVPALLALAFWRYPAVEKAGQAALGARGFGLALRAGITLQALQFALLLPQVFHASPVEVLGPAGLPVAEAMLAQAAADREAWNHGGARRYYAQDQRFLSEQESAALAGQPRQSVQTFHQWLHWSFNIPRYFGVDTATGQHTLQPRWYLDFWSRLADQPERLFDILGIRYVSRYDEKGAVRLSLNEDALPYVFFPEKVETADSLTGAVARLREPAYDWRKSVVIGGNRKEAHGLPESAPNRDLVTGLERGYGSLRLGIRSETAAPRRVLVWNETFHDHWRAEVNGEPAEPFRANGWALGVALPETAAGASHSVLFRYREPRLPWGFAALAAGLLLCLALIREPRARRLFARR